MNLKNELQEAIKFVCFCLFLTFACWVTWHLAKNDALRKYPKFERIPLNRQVEQMQRALTNMGNERYDPCGIDNIPGPKFRRAYENYCNDQEAAKYFTPSGAPK